MSENTAGARIVKTVTRTVSTYVPAAQTDLVFATVIGVKPMTIKLEDGSIIPETFIVLSPLAQEFRINTLHKHKYSGTTSDTATYSDVTERAGAGFPIEDSGDLLVWRGLNIGDRVIVLKTSGGQKYYILHRKEGLTQV